MLTVHVVSPLTSTVALQAARALFKPPWVAVTAPTLASITAPPAAVALCRAATDLMAVVSVRLSYSVWSGRLCM